LCDRFLKYSFSNTPLKFRFLLPLLVVAITTLSLSPDRVTFTQDLALSFGVGDLGTAGELALQGPPSHRGGRHLGALYYWLLSLSQVIGGGNIFFGLVAMVGINLLCLIPLLYKRSFVFTLGAGIPLLSSAFLLAIRDPWHAHFLILFGALASAWALKAISSPEKDLRWFIFFSSCSVLIHFTSIPLIAGLSAGVVLVFASRRYIPQRSALLTFPTLSAGLLWIPSLFGALLRKPDFPATQHLDAFPFDFARSYKIVSSLATRFSFIEAPWPATFQGVDLVPRPLWIGSILMVIFLSAFRAREHFERWVVLLLPFIAYGSALLFIQPPLYLYFVFGLISLLPLIWGEIAEECLRLLKSPKNRSLLVIPAAIIMSGIGLTLIQLPSIVGTLFTRPAPIFLTLGAAQSISKAILNDAGEEKVLVIVRGEADIMLNSYYVLMGRRYYPEMLDANRFTELASMREQSQEEAPTAYLVVCPHPSTKWRKKMWRELRRTWVEDRKVELPNSPEVRGCEVSRLRRRS